MNLHFVVGRADCMHHSIEELVAAAIKGGVTHVQLREKRATAAEFIEIGRCLHTLLKPQGIPLIINDRVDIMLALNAEGVHLGQSDMPYPEARRLLNGDKIIGLTIETPAQMKQANQWQVEYVGVGPVFPTQTKSDAPQPLGLDGLASLLKLSQHPVIAIGGINAGNIVSVLNTGVQGVAVVSAISHAKEPECASRELKKTLLMRRL